MRVLLASSEVYPYSKTGGLADMVAALAKALHRAGHEVGVVTPLYLGIRERYGPLSNQAGEIDIPLGINRTRGEVWSLERAGAPTLYFVDHPGFFQRAGLYQRDGVDYPDNAERFIFFSKIVTHLSLHLPWKPEVLHVNDWQTAAAALFLKHQRQFPGWEHSPRCCLTIHNLAYQGLFSASQYALTNLPWDYFTPAGVEFYGLFNCLKAGISCADRITTVSPRYAREITEPEYGVGLDGLLRHRHRDLAGIINGVDYDDWNPSKDPHLIQPYSSDNLSGKQANKLALQRELRLPENPDVPLFGNIGRLVDQKGVDILLGALYEMLSSGLQFVLLGSGAAHYQDAYHELAGRFPGQVAVRIGFDEGLSHRIEAGCDFFLMPSRFEPCGLNQMYSLRYGTIPIVRATGGLDDTVVDVRENTEQANGIKFHEYSPQALAKAIRKALVLYGERELFEHFRRNGMNANFSWERTAAQFLAIYQSMIGP